MKFKRILRLFVLIIIIVIASMVPVPINLYRKDNKAKFYIEQIDEQDTEEENNDIKALF